MTMDKISPKYKMQLSDRVDEALWKLKDGQTYKYTENYLKHWQESIGQRFDSFGEGYYDVYNFDIYYKDENNERVDTQQTLQNMPGDVLLRIAVDLGVPTPNYLPVTVEKFKNVFKNENPYVYDNFEKALKELRDNPNLAVSLASSSLEGVIKTILNDEVLFGNTRNDIASDSLTKLSRMIMQKFRRIYGEEKCPMEVQTLATSLSGICKAVDDLRSDKTSAHGKLKDDYVIDNPLWAELVVNSCATVGMFLWEFYSVNKTIIEF